MQLNECDPQGTDWLTARPRCLRSNSQAAVSPQRLQKQSQERLKYKPAPGSLLVLPKLSVSAGGGAKQKDAQKEGNTLQNPNQFFTESNIRSKLGYTGKVLSATTTPLAELISPSLHLDQEVNSAQCAVPGAALPALATLYPLSVSNTNPSVCPYLNFVSAAHMNKTGLGTPWTSSTQNLLTRKLPKSPTKTEQRSRTQTNLTGFTPASLPCPKPAATRISQRCIYYSSRICTQAEKCQSTSVLNDSIRSGLTGYYCRNYGSVHG